MFFNTTVLDPVFLIAKYPVFSQGVLDRAAFSVVSGEYPSVMAACQTSFALGCLTARETGSLRPSPLVFELSMWAGQTIKNPGRFNRPTSSLLLLLGFL